MNSDLIFHITIITLAITGFIISFKHHFKIQSLLNFLFVLVTIRLVQGDVLPEENSLFLTGILGGLTGLNLVAATLLKSNKFRWIIPAVSIVLIYFLGKNELMFGDYSLDLTTTKVTGIIILGFLIGALSCILTFVLKKFFSENDKEYIRSTAQLVLTGLFLIPATFLVSWYGVLLLAIGYFLYNSYSETKRDLLLISLLSLTAAAGFLSIYSVEGIDLTVGKVMAGLFAGAGAYSLGILATKATHPFIKGGLLVLGITVIGLVTLLNNIHPAYGGTESFLAAFVGMALVNSFAGKNEAANVFFPAFLAIGLFLPSDPYEKTLDNTDGIQLSTGETHVIQPVEEEIKGLDAGQLSGSYSIVPETAVISFQLGPKGGITKGAIKEFSGTIDFGKNIENAKFNVKLPTKKLTTFNSMRDESVLGSSYLNEPKHPLMSYASSKMEKKDDGYLLKGSFTLLGKTNPEEVFIKYLGEKDGKQQFVGNASIDRTKYGMAPSPQEGNIVDFTFSMELK